MKFRIAFKSWASVTVILSFLSCLFSLAAVRIAGAEDALTIQPPIIQEEPKPSFLVKPVSKITFEGFYDSTFARKPFCFENAEGRCLKREFELLTDIEGYGRIGDRFSVYYKTEANEDGRITIKKAYGVLKTGNLSWEVGKDTIWIGPGYHGSFLLSNNAEGFLLVRVRTDEPFRLPWIFSHIGEFKYDLFRGWSDNSSLLGHRLSWRPVPLFEIGANQVVYIQPGKHYSLSEYPHVLISSTDNATSGISQAALFDNDQKASIDLALDTPFVHKISPFTNGRIYAEYAGDDSFALWQKEDTKLFRTMWHRQDTKWIWPFPFDFLHIAWMTGVFLTTGDVDFRAEYSQNYSSHPLFYDWYRAAGTQDVRRQGDWYKIFNTRRGMIMGHGMGNDADDLFFETVVRHGLWAFKVDFDQERHGFPDVNRPSNLPPETRDQYRFDPSYRFRTFTLFADLIYNHYRNVDFNNNPLLVDVHPGTRLDEYIAGLGVEIPL